MTSTVLILILAIVVLAVVVIVWAAFFERASREVALVRTGIGGRRVVLDGGVIVIPYFQEVSRVNMQTLRLEVTRAGDAALITKDRLRVDMGVEFYVSVEPTEDGIASASQTLGRRTFQADQLRELIEGMLVDALRSVAARMTMDELHEDRAAFVQDVHDGLRDLLARNGLGLNSVSLTALDQTPFSALDENNAFNAEGMRKLAEVIAKSKKERAEIDSAAEVSVRQAAMEATKRKLQIDLEEQEAEIAQTREIEALKAAQLADVAKQKALAEQTAAHARIQMEREIRAADIAREQATREAEIAKERTLQEAEISRERDIEIASKDRLITLADKSQEESAAIANADAARVKAVQSAESLTTARQVADAERSAEIAAINAKRDAETEAIRVRLAAEAQKTAASDRAAAAETEAEGKRKALIAEAEGQRALNVSQNEQQQHIVDMKVELARLEALPKVLAEMVKPAEKIDSIKVHHISGMGGSGNSAETGGKAPVNQVLDSIMEMAVQMPALKKIGDELGVSLAKEMPDSDTGKTSEDS